MAGSVRIRSLAFGLAILLPVLPAAAAPKLDATQAGLCSAAMKIKRDELPASVREALTFAKAADWFTKTGYEIAPDVFGSVEREHRDVLLTAQSNGDAKFSRAVDGCLTYYETSSGE